MTSRRSPSLHFFASAQVPSGSVTHPAVPACASEGGAPPTTTVLFGSLVYGVLSPWTVASSPPHATKTKPPARARAMFFMSMRREYVGQNGAKIGHSTVRADRHMRHAVRDADGPRLR